MLIESSFPPSRTSKLSTWAINYYYILDARRLFSKIVLYTLHHTMLNLAWGYESMDPTIVIMTISQKTKIKNECIFHYKKKYTTVLVFFLQYSHFFKKYNYMTSQKVFFRWFVMRVLNPISKKLPKVHP